MNRLEVMEWSSVRESVKYFMNDKRQDLGTTTYGVMNEVKLLKQNYLFVCLFIIYTCIYIFIKNELNRAVLWP